MHFSQASNIACNFIINQFCCIYDQLSKSITSVPSAAACVYAIRHINVFELVPSICSGRAVQSRSTLNTQFMLCLFVCVSLICLYFSNSSYISPNGSSLIFWFIYVFLLFLLSFLGKRTKCDVCVFVYGTCFFFSQSSWHMWVRMCVCLRWVIVLPWCHLSEWNTAYSCRCERQSI